MQLAEKGVSALESNAALLRGLNTRAGQLTYAGVADAFEMQAVRPEAALA
jgi:alanine dehydrogenase